MLLTLNQAIASGMKWKHYLNYKSIQYIHLCCYSLYVGDDEKIFQVTESVKSSQALQEVLLEDIT